MKSKKNIESRPFKTYWKLPEDAGRIPHDAMKDLEIACDMLGMSKKWLHSK
ncbi:MAG: hypothetical protein AABX39_04105 [Nanoarchaeota archaeon]